MDLQTVIHAPGVEKDQRGSPLYRVPEEILGLIIKELDGDVVALLCVGQVSRRLRRNAHAELLPHDLNSGTYYWRAESVVFLSNLRVQYTALKNRSESDWRMLRNLLRQDRLCQSCVAYSKANGEPWDGCKFICPDPAYILHCAGCETVHPSSAFSIKEKAQEDSLRLCIGREVPLRLCEHKFIRWDDVENQLLLLAESRRRGGLAPTVCELVCDHESHKQNSGSLDSDTKMEWVPRLRVAVNSRSDVAVECFWIATHRVPLNDQGRINAQDMASVFDADLKGDAKFIIAEAGRTAGVYQAMRCFGDPSCTCLTYQNDTDPAAAVAPGESDTCYSLHYSVSPMYLSSRNHSGSGEESIDVQRLIYSEEAGSALIEITYKRAIGRFDIGDMLSLVRLEREEAQAVKPNPPHFWFHAVDRASYALDQDVTAVGHHVWPACHNTACGNYLLTRQATHCPANESDRKLYDN
ncbi:hypothetical protein QBC40DRAFT_249513 [Triangularia verruculosa]|uniref:F-box domain-containing protein n=1 Tax=Triangularia verruculosa TaxID=2587418 RepID=A0AAN6XRB5_9PEZI|nr:hypothetical protein QBC40DRAFT_249513 [Triangularia verruculosa]